ncbi:MAG TPA: hypothetical protein VE035_17705 [Puia sp.]|nr:hypothetical protein [Puia sp.]
MKRSILMVENDADDRYLTEETFRSEAVEAEIEFIDSTVLPGYLQHITKIPHLIILSLSSQAYDLPGLISSIRNAEGCRPVPLIVLSDVARPGDVEKCYSLGANSFIKKPDSYTNTLFKINTFINYWFGTIELP